MFSLAKSRLFVLTVIEPRHIRWGRKSFGSENSLIKRWLFAHFADRDGEWCKPILCQGWKEISPVIQSRVRTTSDEMRTRSKQIQVDDHRNHKDLFWENSSNFTQKAEIIRKHESSTINTALKWIRLLCASCRQVKKCLFEVKLFCFSPLRISCLFWRAVVCWFSLFFLFYFDVMNFTRFHNFY